MKLSEELTWRGFVAENTFTSIAELDEHTRKFYLGVDPSADSMTIGNLAALMMCRVFIRHGYEPTLLVGGATGQIGDPKETGERELKTLSEIEHNKNSIAEQFRRIVGADFRLVDNYDWFKDFGYLDFLRKISKEFSMTQLLDRKFVKDRIGEGGSGISLAEFCYTTIQGYDFLHLYRTYGIDLQLCGADQFGNCTSGLHLIKRLENAEADVWSTPLVIDKVTGRKFGKSEGNAVWLSEQKTSILDFYQFWLNLDDAGIEYYMKIYTDLEKDDVDATMEKHRADPSQRLAQKVLARGATAIVHGAAKASGVVKITTLLFGGANISDFSAADLDLLADSLPTIQGEATLVGALADTGIASSKSDARSLITSGAVSVNGAKVTDPSAAVSGGSLIKKGKNKFILIK